MKNYIKVKDRYYILANLSLAEEKMSVLKSGAMFAVFRHNGDMGAYDLEGDGVYFQGARFLSKLGFMVQDSRPLLLSSIVKDDNHFFTIDLTNPDIQNDHKAVIKKGSLHLLRIIFLKDHVFHETLKITNYSLSDTDFLFAYDFDADFKDIFEVRGMHRQKRGKLGSRVVNKESYRFSYEGLDGILRCTTMRFPKGFTVEDKQAKFKIRLKPHETKAFEIMITCSAEPSPDKDMCLGPAISRTETFSPEACTIETSNYQFNKWINRSRADVLMMLTTTRYGPYPYAGIPWYNTVFGRDGLITALETLWFYPEIARGVLNYLSHYQAKTSDPQKDAEPGKILHEMRVGEMVNLKEIPFGLYYGTVDATPLFLILAGHYYDRRADTGLIQKLWPSLMAALQWIDQYGDADKDGFVEYQTRCAKGLSQQGWKDSSDSVFHRDGTLAQGPIALCEVQAYVYEAKRQMAKLAAVLGHEALAHELLRQARSLQVNFQRTFWCKDLKTFALALDGHKKPCRVIASNAGHALFSNIASPEQARLLSRNLTGKKCFSGWGIRTVGSSERRYNPVSYHNGSIWPHDNAMIAHGFSRYGLKQQVLDVINAFFEASFFMDANRLPELFCGFEHRQGEGPTLYPTACSPQTWASASVFMLIQACLGLRIDGGKGIVYLDKPVLPAYIEELKIRNMKVGAGRLDIGITYHKEGVGVRVLKREGKIEVMTRK